MQLAGLDIETTGTDVNKQHRLIQIGVALLDGRELAQDVQPSGDIVIEAEALSINGFTLEHIGKAPKTAEADNLVSKSLSDWGFKAGELTPVGWNVGGFDITFIKRELPNTATFFSYRALDLTGIAMLYELKTGKSYRDLKEMFHSAIAEKLGEDKRHDALYDAKAALIAVELFRDLEW